MKGDAARAQLLTLGTKDGVFKLDQWPMRVIRPKCPPHLVWSHRLRTRDGPGDTLTVKWLLKNTSNEKKRIDYLADDTCYLVDAANKKKYFVGARSRPSVLGPRQIGPCIGR